MNILLGDDKLADYKERYILLALDKFKIAGHDEPVQSYCLVETIPVEELALTASWKELHENLITNYGKRNWDYCEQAIEHLMDKWNGELNSFYLDLDGRIKSYKKQEPGPDWTPVINR